MAQPFQDLYQEFEKKGVEKGIEQGIEKGIEKEKYAVAKKMLLKNMDLNVIAEITELHVDEIKKIKEALN